MRTYISARGEGPDLACRLVAWWRLRPATARPEQTRDLRGLGPEAGRCLRRDGERPRVTRATAVMPAFGFASDFLQCRAGRVGHDLAGRQPWA